MRITHVQAGGDLTVHSIREVAPALIEVARSGRRVQIDLQGVARIDTAGVQLLLLLCREARQSSGELSFAHASEAVRSLLTLYQVDDVLTRVQ